MQLKEFCRKYKNAIQSVDYNGISPQIGEILARAGWMADSCQGARDYNMWKELERGRKVDDLKIAAKYIANEIVGRDMSGRVGDRNFTRMKAAIFAAAVENGTVKENKLVRISTEDLIAELIKRKFEGEENDKATRKDLGKTEDHTPFGADTCPSGEKPEDSTPIAGII